MGITWSVISGVAGRVQEIRSINIRYTIHRGRLRIV